MSDDTLTVRAPCEHGYHDTHPIVGPVQLPGLKYEPLEGWCPGGREIVLRKMLYDKTWRDDSGSLTIVDEVWVEVDK